MIETLGTDRRTAADMPWLDELAAIAACNDAPKLRGLYAKHLGEIAARTLAMGVVAGRLKELGCDLTKKALAITIRAEDIEKGDY